MTDPSRPAFLDRPAARGLAALVLLLCGGLLGYLHREDLRSSMGSGDPAADEAIATADPAAPCIERRFSEIDGMVDEGIVASEQAALFKQRAEAMCRATEGDGGGSPSPLPVE